MNLKNSRKKLPIHENADANITCDFGAVLGVSYLTHVPQARTNPHSHVDFLNLMVILPRSRQCICQTRCYYHMYADGTQLYIEVPRDQPKRATDNLSCCILDVKKWMTLNKLTLNCRRTEVIAITTAATRDPRPIVVHVDTEALRPKPYVRDIGIVLDDTMNMDWHVSHTCRLAYHHLRSIAKVRNSLTMTACKTMVLILVISRLDFGNATLYGISETLLHRLQVVQNSAARLIMRVRKREHITPILFALHWLPVRHRIQYKILTLV